MPTCDQENLVLERDFFLSLLELGQHDAPRPFLDEALDLIMRLCDADKGYLQLDTPVGGTVQVPFFAARAVSERELEGIRSSLSSTIMSETLRSGQTVETASASSDDRFREQDSVRRHRIEAVVCSPIMLGAVPIGLIYLQGHQPTRKFPPRAKRFAELFARHVAPIVSRLAARFDDRQSDPTLPWRQRLVATEGLVGRSAGLAAALKTAALVAPLDLHLLITGPSGCGKTALAKIIASNGPRGGRPYVELNCANIPENLLESELFGAMPGSHSAASTRTHGKLHAAEGGTLFLDEIGELSPNAQAKLLQLLQSKTYYPLGANKPVQADVRIIAATNADLGEAVANGTFREDLFYRLGVMPIHISSLDERRSDIAPLAEFLCRQACERLNLPVITLTQAAVRGLELRDWPGNVRELDNCLQAAVVRAHGDQAPCVDTPHLFPAAPSDGGGTTFHSAVEAFQRKLVTDALEESGQRVTEAASKLGISRSHLYNLIRTLGIRRDE